jgi:hypothetical protein
MENIMKLNDNEDLGVEFNSLDKRWWVIKYVKIGNLTKIVPIGNYGYKTKYIAVDVKNRLLKKMYA